MVRVREGSVAWHTMRLVRWMDEHGMVSITVFLAGYFTLLIALGM